MKQWQKADSKECKYFARKVAARRQRLQKLAAATNARHSPVYTCGQANSSREICWMSQQCDFKMSGNFDG